MYTMEPLGEYLQHTEMEEGKGTGRDLAKDCFDVLGENNSVDSLEAVLLDGTPTNAGKKTGCVCVLERHPAIRRNLVWLVCQLPGNELPL